MMLALIAQVLWSALILWPARAERDISPEASILFQNGAANGRVPRCQLLRREATDRPVFVTHVLTTPERTTTRFPKTAEALGHEIDSMAAMLSLLVGNDSLPAARSYVNVLLTSKAAGGGRFLLSQSFKVVSPYLKVTGGAADALSVKTLQLHMLVPMTGLDYSLAPPLAHTKSLSRITALLPAGDYAVEVQIVRADGKGKGGGNARVGGWQKLPSLPAGNALDQATLRQGDDVMGCVRMEHTVSWMEVDGPVTNAMPVMLSEDGRQYEQPTGRRGDEAEPFVSTELLYVRTAGVPFPMNVSSMKASLTAVSAKGMKGRHCPVALRSPTVIGLLATHRHLATFFVPPVPAACEKIRYHLEYVYPDGRHRVKLDFHVWGERPSSDESLSLAAMVADNVTLVDKLVTSIPMVLKWSNSLFLHTFAPELDYQQVVRSLSDLASLRDLQALGVDRADSSWTVDRTLTATLVDAMQALADVSYDNPLAAYEQNMIYVESFNETDDFVDNAEDYLGPDMTALSVALSATDDAGGFPICVMSVVLGALQEFNTAAAKLARMVASMKALVVQIQMLRGRDATVTLSEMLQSLRVEAGQPVPDSVATPLLRLYTYAMLTEVMVKNMQRTQWRLMGAASCFVPCFANATYETRIEATCDSFFDAPLSYELERFTTHPQGCVAGWYPLEIARLNALVNGTSTLLRDLAHWMPADVHAWSAWSIAWDDLESLAVQPASRIKQPVRAAQVTEVRTDSGDHDEHACFAADKDGGRAVAYQCRCSSLQDGDRLRPLSVGVTYWLSSQNRSCTDLATIRIPMSHAPTVVRPESIDLYGLSDDDGRTGRYHRAPVPGWDDVYRHGQRPEWLLLLLRGRSSCPKGQWVVTNAALSPWKMYTNPEFPLNNTTDIAVAQFSECRFGTVDEIDQFRREASYNISEFEMMNGYRLGVAR